MDAAVPLPASTGLRTAGISNKWNHALLHCPSVTSFFHRQNVQGASMLRQEPDSPSFASLSSMPLYGETPICLSICRWTLGLLPPLAMVINTAVRTHVPRPLPASASHLLGCLFQSGIAGSDGNSKFHVQVFGKIPHRFLQPPHHSTSPPAMHGILIFP